MGGIAETVVSMCISMIIDVCAFDMQDLVVFADRQHAILVLQTEHAHATTGLHFKDGLSFVRLTIALI